jgi:alpha-N-arabinofuranosidase
VTRTAQPVLRLIKRAAAVEEVLAEQPLAAGRCYLKVEAHEQAYSFYVADAPDQWKPVAEGIDGRILSTPVAGGFVGAVIAMYASSNGQPSTNRADFDWFDYVGFDRVGGLRLAQAARSSTALNEPSLVDNSRNSV